MNSDDEVKISYSRVSISAVILTVLALLIENLEILGKYNETSGRISATGSGNQGSRPTENKSQTVNATNNPLEEQSGRARVVLIVEHMRIAKQHQKLRCLSILYLQGVHPRYQTVGNTTEH